MMTAVVLGLAVIVVLLARMGIRIEAITDRINATSKETLEYQASTNRGVYDIKFLLEALTSERDRTTPPDGDQVS
jgi:hypothetical protein